MTQTQQTTKNQSTDLARFNMIEQQIRTWEVLDPVVLDLLGEVHREDFIDESQLGLAFADVELPIGHGQTMLSPKIEGRILQALNIKRTDKVLLVGTGSGYLTALIAKLAKHVDALEIIPELSKQAEARIQKQNIHNVTFYVLDAFSGYTTDKTYDVIVFAGSLQLHPSAAEQMLNIGGRMFAVVGEMPIMQATLTQRVSEGSSRKETLFETCLPPLVNAPQSIKFEF
ncbi:protein-L-isoaspartate O-methyltransferase family protein [Methylotenera versatilis]|uniref:Protein-L-isoaspartate O-methyltransferase n=1 Tax=Methylotenera versatilis (strain 301) TaxID=666681 RepID=D7DP52_METV0|nr:protein-L-isoaspartate O-methyltransferase [Methylotenera versatilis]ADI31083.1 Protein-L-isoaspartate(D-aspartate) O-methyltransferase [Methylotenera versatilis 301]